MAKWSEEAFKPPQAVHACNCIGPQNGEPKCPCMMKDVAVRDGRYIQREQDLGPAPFLKNMAADEAMEGCDQTIKAIAAKQADGASEPTDGIYFFPGNTKIYSSKTENGLFIIKTSEGTYAAPYVEGAKFTKVAE